MGIKRLVDVSFWTDGKVDDFSPEDKYFMLYLLTNPFTKQLGIYEISIKQAAFQMGYSVEAVTVLLERFETKYKMILFSKETNEIAILNFLRHSIIKGGAPVRDCLIREMKQVKNKELLAAVFCHIKQYSGINATVKNLIAEYEEKNGNLLYCNEKENKNNNEIQNDNENENDNESIVPRIVPRYGNESSNDTWNESFQRIADTFNFLCPSLPQVQILSESTKAEIKARLAKYTEETFEQLFTKAEASSFLKGNNKRKWAATFDWLVKEENMAKVLNGNFDNRKDSKRSYDIEAIERMVMNQQNPPPTAADNPELAARVEAMRQKLAKSS